MARRIQRRQQIYHLKTADEYLLLLQQRPEEIEALFQHLLVNVTSFFRDPEAYKVIEKKVIPALLEKRQAGDPLRLWVVGCATGEEAYSLAILLLEAFQKARTRPQMQIFATDIDTDALAIARRGRYSQDIESHITRERLDKFFQRDGNGYRVKDELRSAVRFAEHDIIRDPPFGGMNLISCRNVMIYLERKVQERVYEIFHYAVKPGSYLWLGPSESIDGVNDLFAVEDKKQRIFVHRHLPRTAQSSVIQQSLSRHSPARGNDKTPPAEYSISQLHERLILSQYAPASVIVNDNFDIIHTLGDTSPYLTIPPGDPTHNLMKVARRGLRMALRGALHQAFNQHRSARFENIRIQNPGGDLLMTLEVQPVFEPPFIQPHAMVCFQRLKELPAGSLPLTDSSADGNHVTDPVIDQLEEELLQARRQLQSTIEAYETSNEELQSSNEELRSMNEELQSATEELEASKEEFQSMNEELSLVNQTLKTKIEELSRANSDLRNFLTATDIGTMFLDRDLCVIRFTPRIKDVFNIISSDKGRPLSHLTHSLDYPTLEEDVRTVLENLSVIEREIRSSNNKWYLARLLPYRTVEEQIGGIVLTLTDITERKQFEGELRFDADILARIADAVVALDNDGLVTYLNAAAVALYHLDPEQIAGKPFSEFVESRFADNTGETRAREQLERHGYCHSHLLHVTRDGREIPVDVTMSLLTDDSGMRIGRLSVIRDVTERKRAIQALEESEERLRRITDAVPGAVFKLAQLPSGQRTFLFISRGSKDVIGIDPDQIIGDMETLQNLIYPTDFTTVRKAMDESVASMEPFLTEYRIRSSDGRMKWITMSAQPHPAPEGAVIWNGFLLDSTERREREDFVRSIYEGVESPIAVVDVSKNGEFVITDINPAYDRLLQRFNVEIRGKKFVELKEIFSESMYEPLLYHYSKCLSTGAALQYERKFEINGQSEWFLTRLSPLRNAQGRIFRIIAMSHLITETKQHEEQQVRASKLEALGVLAGGIAHDFNNIIMGISLNLDLLMNELDPDDQLVPLVRESSYATNRAGELSRRLLVFAKGGKPVKQIVDLKPAIRSVVDFALTGSNLKAQYDVDPQLQCVDADLGQISQVFDNLVINAREACRNGGLLEVRAHNLDIEEGQIVGLASGRYVCVEIQDHGPGIPPDLTNKIFDPYFTTKSGGNGIGLATCYTTIKNHAGAIVVESQAGLGATFSVYLPATHANRQESLPPAPTFDGGSYRLLLIDDDSLILSTMSRALRLHGYHVETSPEGADGAKIYKEALESGNPFDFVLLDANIPGGLGGEVALRALREVDPAARVILCSGYSASNLLSDWESLGFKGRLQKPFSVYDVTNVIRKALVK